MGIRSGLRCGVWLGGILGGFIAMAWTESLLRMFTVIESSVALAIIRKHMHQRITRTRRRRLRYPSAINHVPWGYG